MDEDIIKERNSKYCYQNSNTLINKLEIKDQLTLQKYEARITAAKLLALRQKGITGNFDKNHFVSIHKYIFEDIYPFAGKFRTENIAKGYFRFAEWEYIEEELDKLIDQMAKALIEENKRAVGADVAEAAIEKIDKDSKKKTKEEKGGEEDGKKTKTTRRKSTRSI